jgi:chromosome partitioning protein spoOJ
MEIIKVELSKLIIDENQPRKIFDEEQIKNLSLSIKKYGLLQPILVRQLEDKYKIIAGERRYRACKLANIKYVDVIIKENENITQIALIENIQRENLTPLEEANAILKLKNENNYTHEELSKILGKTRVYITNKLRILGIDDFTKSLLERGDISEGHARALLAEKDISKRQKLAKKILSEGLSVRAVEKSVKKSDIISKDEDFDELIQMLEEKLGTKVSIQNNNQSGNIIIEYYSLDQLQDIVSNMIDNVI